MISHSPMFFYLPPLELFFYLPSFGGVGGGFWRGLRIHGQQEFLVVAGVEHAVVDGVHRLH